MSCCREPRGAAAEFTLIRGESSTGSSPQHHDSDSLQREDARAPSGVSLLLLRPASAQTRPSQRQDQWRGGPEPVQYPRHGGDRAEQTLQRTGLRGHPQAPLLRRESRAQSDHPTPAQTLPGGDPKEAGGRAREEKVPGGGAVETPGRAQGARARGGPESLNQRAPGAAAQKYAPERLTGAASGVMMA